MLESSISEAGVLVPPLHREEDGYTIAGFTAADAPDIPRAFRAVYGEDYLSPLVYDPAAFIELIASGEQISLIARDPEGDIAGHIALAFSSPNRGVVELCQGIVTPEHRKSGIFVRMIDRALDFARTTLGAQAILGISLTNHIVSQKVVCKLGFRDVGMEVDYVPQRMLVQEGAAGPAATLLQYLDLGRSVHAPCHLPPSYALWFARLLNDASISGHRQITLATGLDQRPSICENKDMPRFDMARLVVRRAGNDFWTLVGDHEARAEAEGRRSFQVFIGLGTPEGAAAVELLRGWGYACSGLMPGYLEGGQHVAIMYRSFEEPYFEGIQLHNAGAQRLLDSVRADWQRAERLGAELRHAFVDEAVEAPSQAALPMLPDSARAPMETTMQLLGLGGRVPLQNGGMTPVDLEGESDAGDPRIPIPEDAPQDEAGTDKPRGAALQ
ncbi:GNAT family N-acetyltransferase [Pelagibius marinus]|uniref:GNAT family N-acetyltransferase n=1 Tax=Pelagibius marinus TaxID=2762760 RepID=UPI0018728B47|nr:GNAT family N-acetyltransferase [Pelagibius marinus]